MKCCWWWWWWWWHVYDNGGHIGHPSLSSNLEPRNPSLLLLLLLLLLVSNLSWIHIFVSPMKEDVIVIWRIECAEIEAVALIKNSMNTNFCISVFRCVKPNNSSPFPGLTFHNNTMMKRRESVTFSCPSILFYLKQDGWSVSVLLANINYDYWLIHHHYNKPIVHRTETMMMIDNYYTNTTNIDVNHHRKNDWKQFFFFL